MTTLTLKRRMTPKLHSIPKSNLDLSVGEMGDCRTIPLALATLSDLSVRLTFNAT